MDLVDKSTRDEAQAVLDDAAALILEKNTGSVSSNLRIEGSDIASSFSFDMAAESMSGTGLLRAVASGSEPGGYIRMHYRTFPDAVGFVVGSDDRIVVNLPRAAALELISPQFLEMADVDALAEVDVPAVMRVSGDGLPTGLSVNLADVVRADDAAGGTLGDAFLADDTERQFGDEPTAEQMDEFGQIAVQLGFSSFGNGGEIVRPAKRDTVRAKPGQDTVDRACASASGPDDWPATPDDVGAGA